MQYIITLVLVGLLVGCKNNSPQPEDPGVKNIQQPQEFSPSSIAGLKLWFKADALPVITDGTPIAIWPDSSATHLDAAQINVSSRPIYKAAMLNGKPVVHFNGTQYMSTPSDANILSEQGTLIAVYAATSPYGTGFVAGFPYSATDTTWQPPWVGFELGTNGSQGRFWVNIAGTNREFTAGTMPSNTFHTQSFSFDGSMRSGYINGTSVYSNNTVSGVVTYSGVPAFMLGMRSATAVGEFLTGDIAEVLYYSTALSLADMQKIETYLKSKYTHY